MGFNARTRAVIVTKTAGEGPSSTNLLTGLDITTGGWSAHLWRQFDFSSNEPVPYLPEEDLDPDSFFSEFADSLLDDLLAIS